MYPTRRLIFAVLLGVPLSLLGALLVPSLWLVGVVWILFSTGLFALDALLAAGGRSLTCTLETPPALGVGHAARARLGFAFAGAAPRAVEWAIEAGPRLALLPPRGRQALAAGTAATEVVLDPLRRGSEAIARLWARWQGPLGLCWRQRIVTLDRTIAILPDIAGVKADAVRLLQRRAGTAGLRTQQRPGDGAEFSALREFQSGMDSRAIDWKQSAHHGKLLAREYEAEENLHLIFAIDTGRLMCEPLAGLPRIDRAIHAMLLLSFVSLRLGDRVGLFAFDEKPVLSSGLVAGANAFAVLQSVAARLDYSAVETNITLGLTQLAGELQRRAIVVVFTDFFDTTGAELMIENVGRLLARHTVVFVTFRDEELETLAGAPPQTPADVTRAVLADAMLRERRAVAGRLRRMGVDVVDVPLAAIGTRLIETYLAVKTREGVRHGADTA